MAKDSFFSDITKWTEEATQEIAEETAATTRRIFTMIVDRSPVLTGRFVANWHVGPTDVNYSTMDKMDWDAKIAEINATITPKYFLKNTSAYLINNLDYTTNVEYKGWTYTMAYAPVQKTMKKLGNGFAPVGQTMGEIAGGV